MKPPFRTHMAPEAFYQSLDRGIRFAVRILHARGFETCQSCQGGKGHSYEKPTVEMAAVGGDAAGFAAAHYLEQYGLEVFQLAIVWPFKNAMPYEKNWRIELRRSWPARADERPLFIYGYQATR